MYIRVVDARGKEFKMLVCKENKDCKNYLCENGHKYDSDDVRSPVAKFYDH